MTRQTWNIFAASIAMLGLLLTAPLSQGQGRLGGLRQDHPQSSPGSLSARPHSQTLPPSSPTYTYSLFDVPQSPNTAGFGINNKFEIVGS